MMMVLGWIVAFLCAIIACAVIVLGRRELGRMARFLDDHDLVSNERLTVSVRSAGFLDLARAMNAQMDAAAQQKRDMQAQQRAFQRDLASLSHDIRTPLAGAKGYVQLAEGEEDKARRRHDLRMAVERLDAMRLLLDQLFSYTRSTDPDRELRADPVDAVPLLEEVLAAAFPQFDERGWQPHVSLEDGLCAVVDADALRRVFQNIVWNQLAHAAGVPSIVQEGRCLSFTNPIGEDAMIDPARVFDRFYRSDDARCTPGAGLGLAVVRELCDAMGIKATVHVDRQTFCICVRFPDDGFEARGGSCEIHAVLQQPGA